jgi:transposase
MKSAKRRRVDVNLDELDRVLEGARQAPLSEADCDKLKSVLHAMAAMLVPPHNTEKTRAVLEEPENPETGDSTQPDRNVPPQPGHGRNGAEAFGGARTVGIAHQKLTHGDRCPECGKGNVYGPKEPKVLVRIVGQAPLAATVYSLERLRCGACGQVFTAQEPEGVGPEKYDETVAAIIAQLKYGSGTPFYRLEKLEGQLGISLPAATQWEVVEEAAELVKPARDELIRQAAQSEVVHNDDTSMKVLKLEREPGDERTGVFTSGIVSTGLPSGMEILVAHFLAHGRRQFVEVVQNFPEECRHVLEMLGEVYRYDAEARESGLTAEERLRFHQERSGPVMEKLHGWLEAEFAERKTEPNSGLGKAITYLLRHWKALTTFLREASAPLDNNLCERALKRAVLHRKNALFYRTLHGAEVGDLFMTLIHTFQLCGANSFDYLTELQRHARELTASPAQWMPRNYRETLARS